MKQEITRRQLLTRIAAVGGSAALTRAMAGLGLMGAVSPSHALQIGPDPRFGMKTGDGRITVAIIGAGLSGLTAAYELSQRGFRCKIFEADNRAKGRTFTVRPDGTSDSWYREAIKKGKSRSQGIKGRPTETCDFNELDGLGSLYFEAGAGRIPSHHRTVLNYCKKFGVDLEGYVFASRSNLVRSDDFNDGRPVEIRRFKHNLRGYLAEMFRTANSERLNGTPDNEEKQRLLNALAESFGELSDSYEYSDRLTRAGYRPPGPGAGGQQGEFWKPFAFDDLLRAEDITEILYNDMRYYWQASLMQPVGGIDNIAAAFMRQPAIPELDRVGNLIRLSRKVKGIRLRSDGVEVTDVLVDELGNTIGRKESKTFDYCISTIAPSLLAQVSNNFDKNFARALVDGVTNVHACKVAWQSDRFWESDKYQIYGGISWTTDQISQIWYPSTGFHSKRGILTGAYMRNGQGAEKAPATDFGKLSHEDRVNAALAQGVKIHPELGEKHNDISKAMTIAWQNMPFQAGGWFEYSKDQREKHYPTLLAGQRNRLFMAGDAISYNPGWMEGALAAARMATNNIIQEVLKTRV